MWNHFGRKGLVLGGALGAGLWLLAGIGAALAAQNEVRLPVEKSVRLTSPQEPAARTADARSEKKAEPVAAPRAPETAKPETAKPEAAKPEAAKPEPAGPEAKKPAAKASAPVAEPRPAEPKLTETRPVEAKAAAAKPAQKPKAAPAAEADTAPVAEAAPKVPAPAPKPAPKPKPEPVIDPLALETPAQHAREAISLPEAGQFVGEVELEFLADRVILRATSNGPVERVSHFSLTDPSGPRKLALDMRGGWRKKGATVLRFDTGPVKAVVTGHHPDRLRLAVEFRQGAVAQDMQPVVELGPGGFTATIPLAVRLKR